MPIIEAETNAQIAAAYADMATADDLVALIMWELVECMQTSEPEAPSNGLFVDSWHASAAALQCFAMMLRLKAQIAIAEVNARLSELRALRYMAARSETPGDIVKECDQGIAELENRLEKQKAGKV